MNNTPELTDETPEIRDEFVLIDFRFAEAEAIIAKLNKRARFLGVPETTLTVLEQFEKSVRIKGFTDPLADELLSDLVPQEIRTFYRVKIQGEAPKFAGYKLTGVIEHVPALPIEAPCPDCEGKGQITREPTQEEKDGLQTVAATYPPDVLAKCVDALAKSLSHPCERCGGKAQIVTGHLDPLNVFHCVPGESIPAQYRDCEPWCEHCKTHRRRVDTVVVQHEDGKFVQVGKQCLKDFLGHSDPKNLVSYLEYYRQLIGLGEDGGDDDDSDGCAWSGGGGRKAKDLDLPFYLTHVAYFARVHGWLSATTYRQRTEEQGYCDPTTAGRASANIDLILRPQKDRYGNRVQPEQPLKIDQTQAEAALEWVRGLPRREWEKSDYLTNLVAVCRQKGVSGRNEGIAASLIAAYQKHLDRQTERTAKEAREQAERAAAPESRHLGKEGERLEIQVTCERYFSRDTDYGISYIYKLVDADGNRLVWFSSSPALGKGGVYKLRGTVKAHSEYKGVRETSLSRCKVLETLTEPVEDEEVTEERDRIRQGGRRYFQGCAGTRW
jgi:hypothetical protein